MKFLKKHRLLILACLILMVNSRATYATLPELQDCPSSSGPWGYLRATYISELPARLVFFKIDQGVSFNRLLDQRMSNLHYSGPGAVLAFSRNVLSPGYISEINFASIGFHYTKPGHGGTQIYNPAFGIGYMYLHSMNTGSNVGLYLGGRADAFGNLRIVPSLGNSFLFTDFVAEIKPEARLELSPYLLNRYWNIDLSMSAALAGFSLRHPEYATVYQIDSEGGVNMFENESLLLYPGNYAHLNTGIFLRGSLGGQYNPNGYRIGYSWDYYRISGRHNLTVNNTSHSLVLELYFMVN